MKKAVIVLLLIAAALSSFFYLCINVHTYAISEPYQYPVRPGTREWNALESPYEMVKACMVPNEIVQQMTTQALLETYLDYPLIGTLFLFSSPTVAFEMMKEDGHFDLYELMSREDLCQTVYERYIAIDYLVEDVLSLVDEPLEEDARLRIFKKEWDDWWDVRCLEVLAVQLQLSGDRNIDKRLLQEIDRRYLLKIAKNEFKDSAVQSEYYWTLERDETRKRVHSPLYKK